MHILSVHQPIEPLDAAQALKFLLGGMVPSAFRPAGASLHSYSIPRVNINLPQSHSIDGIAEFLEHPFLLPQNACAVIRGKAVLTREIDTCCIGTLSDGNGVFFPFHADLRTTPESIAASLELLFEHYPDRAWSVSLMGASGVSIPGDGRWKISEGNVLKVLECLIPYDNLTLVSADVLRQEHPQHVDACLWVPSADGSYRAISIARDSFALGRFRSDDIGNALCNFGKSEQDMKFCLFMTENGQEYAYPYVMPRAAAQMFWKEIYHQQNMDYHIHQFKPTAPIEIKERLGTLANTYLPIFCDLLEAAIHAVCPDEETEVMEAAQKILSAFSDYDYSGMPRIGVAKNAALRKMSALASDAANTQAQEGLHAVFGDEREHLMAAATILGALQSLPIFIAEGITHDHNRAAFILATQDLFVRQEEGIIINNPALERYITDVENASSLSVNRGLTRFS